MNIKPRRRISVVTRDLLITYAIFVDVLGALANLLVGIGSTIVNWTLGYPVIWFAFLLKGVFLFRNKKVAKRFAITGIIEFIPILNIVPAMTWFVWKTCAIIKQEDEEYNRSIEVQASKKEQAPE